MPRDDRKLSLWLTPLSLVRKNQGLSGVAVYPNLVHYTSISPSRNKFLPK
jgi:hypothetical protein